ncbi:MAG TPA: exodeoxyribonuclease VII large subunit [Acidimicrobiales bacterium]|nr:exodeoxyribonuclease VII large subunit [Acidimicrobiales bacterium]
MRTRPATPLVAQLAGMEHVEATSVSSLLAGVRAAVADAFPRDLPLWVRGEIQSIADHRSGHCYIELVDPDVPRDADSPVLKVNCWRSVWGPLKATLDKQGIALEEGMVVTLRGRVEFYAPRGQVNFIAAELDVHALLGRLALRRAALLAALDEEGLLTRNRALPVAPVPIRVGLVASPGTEGYRDFLGQLLGSGVGFHVRHASTHVQGARAAAAVAAGVAVLTDAGCDLVVVVRGGGSKADLAVFDSEVVARAIATAPSPVWTGIGHTGDQSVADIVANRAFITPTECGQAVAGRVLGWWSSAAERAGIVAARATVTLQEAAQRDVIARQRLATGVRRQLERHGDRLGERGSRLAARAPRLLEVAELSVTRRAALLGPRAVGLLEREADRAGAWRRLLAAYDVTRQLERGYTLTFDDGGRLVRGVAGVGPGTALVTRFADGTARSVVERTARAPSAGAADASGGFGTAHGHTGVQGAEGLEGEDGP